jgi:ankyrin repeat protein
MYLSFDVFKAGACTTEEEFGARFSLHPFLLYAAVHIMHHSLICDQNLSTDIILNILEHQGSLSSYMQAFLSHAYSPPWDYPREHSALHATCIIGHEAAILRLIARRVVVVKYDNQPTSHLHGAANGNGVLAEPSVGVAELAVQDSWGATPLHWAA